MARGKAKQSDPDLEFSEEEQAMLADEEVMGGAPPAEEEVADSRPEESQPEPQKGEQEDQGEQGQKPGEFVPRARLDEVTARYRQLQEEQARKDAQYQKVVETINAAMQKRQSESEQPAEPAKPVLDPKDPNWDPTAHIDYLTRRLSEFEQQFTGQSQQTVQERQMQAALGQLQTMDAAYARDHPEYAPRVQGYIDHQARTLSATHGVPYEQAMSHVQHQMVMAAAQMLDRGQNPFDHWNNALAAYAPQQPAQTNGQGEQQTQQTPEPSQAATSRPSAKDDMMSLSEAAPARSGKANGFKSLADIADMDENELAALSDDFTDRLDSFLMKNARD